MKIIKKMTVVLFHFKQQAASTYMRFKHIAKKKKKTVVFLNLLGKGLTQEINGGRGSI